MIEVAVVPIAHRELGEVPAAVISALSGSDLTPEELRAYSSQRFARYKVPERFAIVSGPLPRNASGKILKGELRDSFQLEDAPPGNLRA